MQSQKLQISIAGPKAFFSTVNHTMQDSSQKMSNSKEKGEFLTTIESFKEFFEQGLTTAGSSKIFETSNSDNRKGQNTISPNKNRKINIISSALKLKTQATVTQPNSKPQSVILSSKSQGKIKWTCLKSYSTKKENNKCITETNWQEYLPTSNEFLLKKFESRNTKINPVVNQISKKNKTQKMINYEEKENPETITLKICEKYENKECPQQKATKKLSHLKIKGLKNIKPSQKINQQIKKQKNNSWIMLSNQKSHHISKDPFENSPSTPINKLIELDNQSPCKFFRKA